MKKVYFFSVLYCFSILLLANNIQVSNVTLTGQDPVNDFTMVQFDLSWENSWRISNGPSNWDAAWVFIKFRENGGPWQHAKLNWVDGTAANDGHTEPSGATIKTTSDNVGCFIYRDANGSGNVNWTGVQLKWDYGASFVDDESMIDIKVLAIEMVYIPQGTFGLGTNTFGATEVDRFMLVTSGNSNAFQYFVQSENQITVASSSAGSGLYYQVQGSHNLGDQSGPIPAAFPKGYDAFYVMKYEVTQDQYVTFYNMLTPDQKPAYDITDNNGKGFNTISYRNTVIITNGQASTTTPSRAMNFVDWRRFSGYLDWSGLRPFTELEYEKMCRKPTATQQTIPNAYPWGNTLINASRYTITNDGAENAEINNPAQGVGNANYALTSVGSTGSGPMRAGIFAASAITKNREETGASYYGVMELGGNLLERCMSVGHPDNRFFTGVHGNGEILNTGDYSHDVTGWPMYIPNNSSSARAYRGGSHGLPAERLRVCDRDWGCRTTSDYFGQDSGIRGARTAE